MNQLRNITFCDELTGDPSSCDDCADEAERADHAAFTAAVEHAVAAHTDKLQAALLELVEAIEEDATSMRAFRARAEARRLVPRRDETSDPCLDWGAER